MSLERNKTLARAAIGIWSTGDFARARELFAPDYVMHQHHDPGDSGDLEVEALTAFAAEFRAAFPDFADTIELQIAEGQLVATRFISAGTHRGEFLGVAATGRRLGWTGTVIDRVEDGRIAESWGNWDMLGMLQQLGVVPARPAPPPAGSGRPALTGCALLLGAGLAFAAGQCDGHPRHDPDAG